MLPKEAATKGKRIMTVRSTFALTVLAALGLAVAHPAAAQTTVFDVGHNPTLTAGKGGFDLYLGNQFTDSATEAVTYLGFFDNGSLQGIDANTGVSNTYYYSHYDQLRIDDITNPAIVAIANVSAITAYGMDYNNIGFQSGQYYYVPATGTIAGGTDTYVIATHQTTGYTGNFDPNAAPTIYDPNVAFKSHAGVLGYYYQGAPQTNNSGDAYYDGASFAVAAPEPAQTAALGLFGLGLGALVLKARKRKASGTAV